MRSERLIGLVAFVAVALLYGQSDADAQAGNAGLAAPAPQAAQGAAPAANLTPSDMIGQADAIIGQIEAARSNVRKQLELAREQRDVLKTLCLNDKLNQLDVAIRSARERKGGLDSAAGRNDTELARHEFAIIAVLKQRTDTLTAEANQCVGKEVALIGESSVIATEEPGLPDQDSTEKSTGEVIIDPPTCSSCIK